MPAAPGDLAALCAAVERLPTTLRRIWIMRYVERMPVANIATILQTRPATIEADLIRALTEIRTKLWREPECKASPTGKHARKLVFGVCRHCGLWALMAVLLVTGCSDPDRWAHVDAPDIGDITCTCNEMHSACAVFVGRDPPRQPQGSVRVFQFQPSGRILGFSCELGTMRVRIPTYEKAPAAVPVSNNSAVIL